jgi:D-glycero-D-manno-heptose 1,7-bisphosphate phosphatase
MIWRLSNQQSELSMSVKNTIAAVFLDRDGTLIEHVPYLCDPRHVVVRPGTREALARLRSAAVKLFLFTNQSGVSRGLFGMDEVEAVNARMVELLALGADLFASVCVAPELPDVEPVYRKPSPRFIDEMLAAHGIPREQAWMVGDSPVDWEAGINAGIRVAAIVPDPLAAKAPERRAELGIQPFPTLLDWLDAVWARA